MSIGGAATLGHKFCYLTLPQYTGTEPVSASVDPMTPGAWLGSHWNYNGRYAMPKKKKKKKKKRRQGRPDYCFTH